MKCASKLLLYTLNLLHNILAWFGLLSGFSSGRSSEKPVPNCRLLVCLPFMHKPVKFLKLLHAAGQPVEEAEKFVETRSDVEKRFFGVVWPVRSVWSEANKPEHKWTEHFSPKLQICSQWNFEHQTLVYIYLPNPLNRDTISSRFNLSGFFLDAGVKRIFKAVPKPWVCQEEHIRP